MPRSSPSEFIVQARASVDRHLVVGDVPRAFAKLASSTIFWSLPALLLAFDLTVFRGYGWDFRAFYAAGHDYLHLRSPYVSPSLANLTTKQNFVYPLPIAAAFVPLSLLPYGVAAAVFIAASGAALILALRVLHVRDWRCYVAVLVGFPAYFGVKLGTLSPILALLLALLWRNRNRMRTATAILTFLVLAKLFLWPLALWFLITRRYRVVVWSAIACVVVVAIASAPFGVAIYWDYGNLLRALSSFEGPFSLSVYGLFVQAGAPSLAATVAVTGLGAYLIFRSFVARQAGDESLAFRLTVVAALVMSPIIWDHYLVLIYVPLALWSPNFSVLWLASAWVSVDGFVVGRPVLMAVTAILWLVVLVQAGVVGEPGAAAIATALRQHRFRIFAAVGLWVGLLTTIIATVRTLPAVAALRPAPGTGGTSGTASLRIDRSGSDVCWRVLTTGIPAGSTIAIVRNGSANYVAMQQLDGHGGLDTCSSFSSSAAGKRLVDVFKKRSGPYSLAVRSAQGKALLNGALVRLVDSAGLLTTPPPQP